MLIQFPLGYMLKFFHNKIRTLKTNSSNKIILIKKESIGHEYTSHKKCGQAQDPHSDSLRVSTQEQYHVSPTKLAESQMITEGKRETNALILSRRAKNIIPEGNFTVKISQSVYVCYQQFQS